jgi:hypothetical protein
MNDSGAMNDATSDRRIEARWPVVLAILSVIVLLTAMPGRIRIFPAWFPIALGTIVIVPTAVCGLVPGKPLWLRIERLFTLIFFVIALAGSIVSQANLITAMISRSSGISGVQLLTSSIAVWVTNVLAFSLLYWQMDRGGPEARTGGTKLKPDWLFPQDGASPEDYPMDWRPAFLDYLSLGFNTSTAFSPTDVLPLTRRAKMLMMLESAISLVTIVVVASRAINILGS